MRLIKLLTKTVAAGTMAVLLLGPLSAYAEPLPNGTGSNSNSPAYTAPTAPGAPCTYVVTTPGVGASSGSGTVQPDGSCSGITTGASATAIDSSGKTLGADNSCSGITGCLASMVYYIGPGFASWVASWAAYFFDYIVRISLNSTAYAIGFLTTAWGLVLSLANMFFIFILIYTAFVIMLKAETSRTMQTLAWVIAIALVVNFSFFFTRVVIDAGNILGTQFYNAVVQQNGSATIGGATDLNSPPDITINLMNAIGVHTLLGPDSFATMQKAIGTGNDKWSTLLVLTVIFLAAAVMFWMIAVSLLMVGVKFLIRVVGLWMVLIASPLAFVSKTMPNTQKFFETWLRTLVSFAFYPAIFLFMFYVLNLFVKGLTEGNNTLVGAIFQNTGAAVGVATAGAGQPYSLLAAIANVSIRMGFVIVLMYIMLKVADWVMEQTGGMAATIMNKASGAILGGGLRTAGRAGALAYRGTAFTGAVAGRNLGGRGAFALLQNPGFKNWKNESGIKGALWRSANKASKGTWDVRNAPGGGVARSVLSGLDKATGLAGAHTSFGKANVGKASARNFAKATADKAKRDEELGKSLKANEGEIWNEQQRFKEEFEAQPENGPGSYTRRVNDLEAGVRRASQQAVEQHDLAAANPLNAGYYKNVAKTFETQAKNLGGELKTLTEAGKKRAEENAKGRLTALANRLDKRNQADNMFNPSWGHIEGAAKVRKMVGDKTASEKIKEAVKEMEEEGGEPTPPAGGGGGGGANPGGGGNTTAHGPTTGGPTTGTGTSASSAHPPATESSEAIDVLHQIEKNTRLAKKGISHLSEVLNTNQHSQPLAEPAQKIHEQTPPAATQPAAPLRPTIASSNTPPVIGAKGADSKFTQHTNNTAPQKPAPTPEPKAPPQDEDLREAA